MFSALIALLFILFDFDTRASAAKHTIIVGTFSTEFLYTIEYDDATEALTLVSRSATSAASSWIALNVNITLGPTL